jgi:hypothetical protein
MRIRKARLQIMEPVFAFGILPFQRKEQEFSMSNSRTTTNHDEIRKWAEARDGHPAVIRTEGEGGILRVDFGEPEEGLESIDWEEFFQIFDNSKLAFLHQDKTGGGALSRFNKFVSRD